MEGNQAGVLWVSVLPSLAGLRAPVRREATATGEAAAKDFDRAFDGASRGRRAGREFRTQLDNATRNIVLKPGMDVSEIAAKTQEIRRRVESLDDIDLSVDVDASRATSELAAVRALVASIEAGDATVSVEADTRAATSALRQVAEVMDGLDGARLDLDTGATERKLSQVTAASRDAERGLDGAGGGGRRAARGLAEFGDSSSSVARTVQGAVLGILTRYALVLGLVTAAGIALIPIAGVLVGALGAIVPIVAAGTVGLVGLALGLRGVGGALSALQGRRNAAVPAAPATWTRGADQSRARQQAARAAEDAAERVVDAQQRVTDAQDDSARAAADAAERIADAQLDVARAVESAARAAEVSQRRIGDAVEGAARVAERAARDRVQAQRRVDDAVERAAEVQRRGSAAVASALAAQSRAERLLADAQRDAAQAQRDVAQARIDGERGLEDQADQLAGGAIREAQQYLDLLDQREAFAATDASLLDPRQAERDRLALEAAELSFAELQRQQARLRADASQAAAAGVEGSTAVRGAQDRVTAALEAQRDAQTAVTDAAAASAQAQQDAQRELAEVAEAVADARASQVQVELDGARDVADADRAVADARAEAARQQLDSARAVQDAEAGVAEARADQDQAAQDSARAVADAVAGVTDALRDQRRQADDAATAAVGAGAAAVGGAVAARDAFDQATPAVQKFAFYLDSLRGTFAAIRDELQVPLLGGLQESIGLLVEKYAPGLERFAGTIGTLLGDLAERAAGVLTGPVFSEFFSVMASVSPAIIEDVARAVGSIASTLASFAVAFAPLAVDLAEGLAGVLGQLAAWAASPEGQQDIQDFIGFVREAAPYVLEFFRVLAVNIGAVATALAPAGLALLNFLTVIVIPTVRTVVEKVTGAFEAIGEFWARVAIRIYAFWLSDVKPALDAFAERADQLRDSVRAAFGLIGDGWEAFIAGLVRVRDEKLYPAWDAIVTRAGELRDDVGAAFTRIGEGFDSLVGGFRDGWAATGKPVLDAVKAAIDGIGPAFTSAVEAITAAWEDMREGAKEPVRFLVDTVINKAIIGNLQKLLDHFDLKTTLPTISLPEGFAAGGWTGPGSKFQPAGIVHADEYVVNKASQRSMRARHPGVLDYINTHGALPGYASGGLVGLGQKLRQMGFTVSENRALGDNPLPGAHSAGGFHYKFGNSGAFDLNNNGAPGGEKKAIDSVVGMIRAAGFRVIWQALGHYDHAHVDVGNRGAAAVGADVAGAPQGIVGRVADVVKQAVTLFTDPASVLRALVGASLGKIGGGQFGEIAAGAGRYAADRAGEWIGLKLADQAAEGPRNAPVLRDNGGWLNPGVTTVANYTGEREMVLTGAQWRTARAALTEGGGSGFAGTVLVENPWTGEQVRAKVTEVADGRIGAHVAARKMRAQRGQTR